MRPLVALALALLVAGCGSEAGGGSSLVDPDKSVLINSLQVDPGGDSALLTTNRGLYRIEDGSATQVDAEAKTPDGPTPVGRFLAVAASPEGDLVGSGHPDGKGKVAGFLGLLSSDDEGRTWEVVSRYSLADLHVIRFAHDLLYASDAVLGMFLISDDGGRNWEELGGPPGLVFDFVVDPENPDDLIASTKDQMYRSTDRAESWTAVAKADATRLAWPEAASLYRADADGLTYRSDNGGDSWDIVGKIDGEPWKLEAAGPEELYAALSDGAIVHSTDGGENWEEYFTP